MASETHMHPDAGPSGEHFAKCICVSLAIRFA
jgi:hypothetical protein